MSDKFPLESDAFSGGSRLTAAQESEGRASNQAPLFSLMNAAAQTAESVAVLSASVDYSAATAAVIAAANRGLTTNTGAARSVTLPDFDSAPAGWEHTFIALDAQTNEFSIVHAGSDTINGVAGDVVMTTSAHEWVKVFKVAGASGWHVIGGTAPTPA